MNSVYLVLITPAATSSLSVIDSVYDTRQKAESKQQEICSTQKFQISEVNVVEMSVL